MAAQPRPGGAARLRSFQPVVVAIALLACVAGTQAWVDAYRPAVNDEAGMAFSGAAVVVRSFAGQLRGLLADFLWLRVDEYAHRRRLVDGDINRADDAALMPLVRLITEHAASAAEKRQGPKRILRQCRQLGLQSHARRSILNIMFGPVLVSPRFSRS